MADLGRAFVTIIPKAEGITNQITNLIDKPAKTAGARAGKSLSTSIGNGITKAGAKFTNFAASGAAAIAGITGSITAKAFGGGIARAMGLDEASAKFKQLGFNWDQGTTNMKNSILASVKNTRYGLDEMAGVAVNFASTGIKAGDGMTNALKSVASAASIAGIDVNHMGAIYTKVAAAGKLTGGVMQQLQENGINANAALQKSLGKSSEEISKMVSSGKISFEEFSTAMRDYFGDAAQSANSTFSGASANVRAALSRLTAEFAAPAFENLRKLFAGEGFEGGGLMEAIDHVSEALQPLAKKFAELVEAVGQKAGKAIETFNSIMRDGGNISEAFKAAISDLIPESLRNRFESLSPFLKKLLTFLGKGAGLVGGVAGGMGVLGGAVGALLPGMSGLVGGLTGSAGAFKLVKGAGNLVIGVIGKLTGGLGGLTSILGKVKGTGGISSIIDGAGEAASSGGENFSAGGSIKKTLTGLANAAIVVTGVTGLVVALGALQKVPHFSEFVDNGGETLSQVFGAIKKVATPQVAGTFAVIEGMGALGVGTAVSGIGALATLLTGLTGLVSAFGALNKIPGINEFVAGGGDLLANIMTQVGRMAGALAKGFAVEITSAFPEIGQNLSGFATNAKPFFDLCANANFSGMEGFAAGIGALVKADLADSFMKLFGSGLNFAGIGQQLAAFAQEMKAYFDAAAQVADMEAGLKLMRITGDLGPLVDAAKDFERGWGHANFEGLGSSLKGFAEKMKPYFDKAAEITDMEAGVKLMSIAGKINKLVKAATNENKIGQMGMEGLADGLTAYAKKMKEYFDAAMGITDMSKGLELASKSGQVQKLASAAIDYKSGSLKTLGQDLAAFSLTFTTFSNNMAGKESSVDVSAVIDQVNKLVQGVSSKGKAFSSAMSSMSSGASKAFGKLKSTFKSGADSVAKSADFSGRVKSALNKVTNAVSNANGSVKRNLSALSRTFSNTSFKLNSYIALPHFSMSGDFDAKKKKVPSVSVRWYKQGGIATEPLIGFGEAGAEALLPLDPFWRKMDDIKDSIQGGSKVVQNVTVNVSGADNPDEWGRRLARTLKMEMRTV